MKAKFPYFISPIEFYNLSVENKSFNREEIEKLLLRIEKDFDYVYENKINREIAIFDYQITITENEIHSG